MRRLLLFLCSGCSVPLRDAPEPWSWTPHGAPPLLRVGESSVGKPGVAPMMELRGGGSSLGAGLAFVPDVDGDGRADLLVGTPHHGEVREASSPWSSETSRHGRVAVHSSATGEVLFEWGGEHPWDYLGFGARSAGDLDGDGVPDVIVGAFPRAGRPGVDLRSGVDGRLLRAWRDSPWGVFVGDADADGSVDVALHGGLRTEVWSAGVPDPLLVLDLLASEVVAGGDVDGDGLPDMIASTGSVDYVDHSGSSGAVRVLSCRDGRQLGALIAPPHERRLAVAVCRAGDLDGDGWEDVWLSGARSVRTAGQWRRTAVRMEYRVRLWSPRTSRVLVALEGDGSTQAFGSQLAAGADLDGDARPDLAVAVQKTNVTDPFAGVSALVLSGARLLAH